MSFLALYNPCLDEKNISCSKVFPFGKKQISSPIGEETKSGIIGQVFIVFEIEKA